VGARGAQHRVISPGRCFANGHSRFRLNGTLKRKSSVPAPIPRGVGPASTTPAASLWQPVPAAKSVADRRSTNSSQSQTRIPTETRREMVLLAASATVIGAWSRAASSCRILSCVRRAREQTRGDAPLSLHTRCAQALARSAPGASTNISKRPSSPHHVFVRCALVVFGASAGAEDKLLLDKLRNCRSTSPLVKIRDAAAKTGTYDTEILQRMQL
jgi:hypothetical protein